MRRLFLTLILLSAFAFVPSARAQSLPTTNAAVSVTLAWNASIFPAGDAITNYTLFFGTASGATNGVYPFSLAAGTNLSVTANLAPSQTYYFAVTATDTNGVTSAFSAEISATTFGIIGAPGGLHVVSMILKPTSIQQIIGK
jgi:hypothetical protein